MDLKKEQGRSGYGVCCYCFGSDDSKMILITRTRISQCALTLEFYLKTWTLSQCM
jgi:hypothetical protein